MSTILVTGGAGFIGSALVRRLVGQTEYRVVNVDKLTYAASLESVASVSSSERYTLERVDICDAAAIRGVFERHRPAGVIHLAAESHVDRSIEGPAVFVQTNVVGTYTLLAESLRYWRSLDGESHERFRFHHVSTDEVYGTLGATGLFTEEAPYRPNSPYAASKAGSDHLARAWHRTYGLPVVTTNCSNNYGPWQHPEKLIPFMIRSALAGRPLGVYGSGENVRDWLYVDDHAEALQLAFERGTPGETYNIGGNAERRNIDVVRAICALLDELVPDSRLGARARLITRVADRPGHDLRYGVDTTKIARELGWRPRESFESGLRKTVEWYVANQEWSPGQ